MPEHFPNATNQLNKSVEKGFGQLNQSTSLSSSINSGLNTGINISSMGAGGYQHYGLNALGENEHLANFRFKLFQINEKKNRFVLFCNLTTFCLCVFGFDSISLFFFFCCKTKTRFRLIRSLDFDWCFNLLMLLGFMSMS